MFLDRLRSLFSHTRVLVGIGIAALIALGAISGSNDLAVTAPVAPQAGAPAALDPGAGPGALGPAPEGEKTIQETAEPWLRDLALTYQPIVKVARADRFWPVSVKAILGLQSGKERTCLRSLRPCPPPPSLSALSPHGAADDFLVYPGKGDDVDGTFAAVMQSLSITADPKSWITDIASDPYKTAQIYFFHSDNMPNPNGPRETDVPRQDRLSLQYWFFYPFNYLPVFARIGALGVEPRAATIRNFGYHEGDFEHVSVVLRRIDGKYVPKYVYMARHDSEGKSFPWGKAVEIQGTHPVVRVAMGGHASYERCGSYRRQPGIAFGPVYVGLQDHIVCDETAATETATPRGGVFTFGPTVPLVELQRNTWACFPGRFGRVIKKTRVERGIKKMLKKWHLPDLVGAVRKIADGPKAPLRQFENAGECR